MAEKVVPNKSVTQGAKAAQPVVKAGRLVEDLVLAVPAFKALEVPQPLQDFYWKLVPRISLDETSWRLLDAFSAPDVNAERVAEIIKGNPYYESFVAQAIKALGAKEAPSLEAGVVLMGMQNTRALVVGLQLFRTIKGQHPPVGKDGKVGFSPKDFLKYAVKTDDALTARKSHEGDIAFAAGVIFDMLMMIANEYSEDKAKIVGLIEQVWGHGFRTAQIAIELAQDLPDFGYRRFLIPACMLHDVGKVLMAFLVPGYMGFVEDCQKSGVTRSVRVFAETTRFGLNHITLGGLAFQCFKMFRPVRKAILFHHEPFILKSRNKDLYQLANLVCLGTNIANHFKKTENIDDPIIAHWKGLELSGLDYDKAAMMAAVSRVQL
ncbi:HDOD domain-containing protein [Bdellovibrionota bacterium FG-2]